VSCELRCATKTTQARPEAVGAGGRTETDDPGYQGGREGRRGDRRQGREMSAIKREWNGAHENEK